jgi:hypothetical protein
MAIGKRDALNALDMGEGGYLALLMDFYHQKEDGLKPNFDSMLNTAMKQAKEVTE